MLKKYKDKLLALLKPVQARPNLDFGCHNVVVEDKNYLMCRAIVPDIAEMLEIESAVYAGDQPWSYEDFEKHIQNKLTSLYIVVRYEYRMVAFAGCDFTYGPSEAHVTNIAVLPEYQHQGLGLMMLKTLQTEAKKYGCRHLSLDVRRSNLEAQALYRRAGFKEVAVKNAYYKDEDGLEYSYNLVNRNLKKRVEKGWKKIRI